MGSPALGPNEFELQCSIEAAPEQWPGKPVMVKGTFHNTGKTTIYIWPWTTFLEPAWPDCVSIAHNGTRVEYVGPAAQFRMPIRDEFIELYPGRSISAEIDISKHYNVWWSGDYELSFRMTVKTGTKVMFNYSGDIGVPVAVQSGTIRFRMAGAKHPLFNGMSEAWERAFRDSYRWAYESIIAGLTDVQRLGPGYRDWFDKNRGDGWQQRHKTVLNSLKAMADWLSRRSILIRHTPDSTACTGNILGVTGVSQEGAIELCPKAFDDSWLWQAYGSAHRGRAFLLVHEISHAAAGTRDMNYDGGACRKFAESDPGSAIVNAQNYAEFALSIYRRPSDALPPDNGIWGDRRVSGGGGHAQYGPAVLEVSPNTAIVAWREPEPPTAHPDTPQFGGLLFYKIVTLFNNGWSNAIRFRPAFEMTNARELRSLVTPALARWNADNYCVYIDASRGLLSVKALSPGQWKGPQSFEELSWTGTYSETEPELICSHREQKIGNIGDNKMRLAPALTAYGARGGRSAGLYCAYVYPDGALRCAAKFSEPPGLGPWTAVNFDKPRRSTSAPALIAVYDEIKCAYFDADKSRYVILTYKAIDDKTRPGTWTEDGSFPDLETKTIALAEWETTGGSRLVAIGSVIPVNGATDMYLRYSILGTDGKWSKQVVTEEYMSNGVPAPLTIRWGPKSLYAFLTGRDGNIQSIRAQA